MLKWTTIGLSLAGLTAGIYVVGASAWHAPVEEPARPAIVNPYPDGIAASGVIEGRDRNVRIAAPESGLVWKVFVRPNDKVSAGAPLFQLDPRPLQADLARAQAAIGVAEQTLKRLQKAPRPEEVAPLQAALKRALARRDHAKREYERIRRLQPGSAASDEQVSEKALEMEESAAALLEADANLERVRVGTWEWDLRVSESSLASAQAEAQVLRVRLERLTVCAPRPGVVLKVNLEVGEFAAVGAEPAIVLADLEVLHVRVQVDEQDAVFLRPGLPAVAVITGRKLLHVPLTMLAIEPLALPKKKLTGATQELVDTRIIEVIFAVQPGSAGAVRLYPGQIVDVFIGTQPAENP